MFRLSPSLTHLLERCQRAAELASSRIMDLYDKGLEGHSKGLDGHYSGDVVTVADTDSQRLIMETLFVEGPQDPLFDDVAVIGEENLNLEGTARFEKPFTLFIDPLDGTRGFLDRTNSFGVSIGLVEQSGKPVFGVVHLSALRRRYTGVAGQSSVRNNFELAPPQLEGKTLVCYVSEAEIFPADNNQRWHRLSARLKEALPIAGVRVQCLGAPVHKGCLASGGDEPALYLGLPRSPKGVSLWDLAAVASIVDGAGGWVSDCFGHPLELNRRESTYVHHRGFVFANHCDLGQQVVSILADELKA
jgi:3'(2'), 5'-bisphosphate nucleotidase/myo-inositol-1(or 4)-monophosphatase